MRGGIHPSGKKAQPKSKNQAPSSGYNKNIKRVDERLYSDAKNRQARKWNSKVAHTLIKQEMDKLDTSTSKSAKNKRKRRGSRTRSVRNSKTSHKQARNRKLNASVDHSVRSVNTVNSTNSGITASNRLYYGGIQNKMSKERQLERLKNNKLHTESADHAFQPQINEISRKIANTKKIYHGDNTNVEERLHRYG